MGIQEGPPLNVTSDLGHLTFKGRIQTRGWQRFTWDEAFVGGQRDGSSAAEGAAVITRPARPVLRGQSKKLA